MQGRDTVSPPLRLFAGLDREYVRTCHDLTSCLRPTPSTPQLPLAAITRHGRYPLKTSVSIDTLIPTE